MAVTDYQAFKLLVDDPLTAERIAFLRSITPGQRLEIARQMYLEARRQKESEIRRQHPEWSEQQARAEVSRIFLAEAMKEG